MAQYPMPKTDVEIWLRTLGFFGVVDIVVRGYDFFCSVDVDAVFSNAELAKKIAYGVIKISVATVLIERKAGYDIDEKIRNIESILKVDDNLLFMSVNEDGFDSSFTRRKDPSSVRYKDCVSRWLELYKEP